MALFETVCQPFRKARAVNQTSASFVSKIPTATEPGNPTPDANTATGASVIDLGLTAGGATQNQVLALFYGTGANATTFSARLIGWRRIVAGNAYSVTDLTTLWVPVVLAEYLCTLTSSMAGVAGKTIVAAELFAGTVALVGTTGNPNVSEEIVSPASTIAAHVVADLKGFQKLEFSFSTGSSATDCNALYALL